MCATEAKCPGLVQKVCGVRSSEDQPVTVRGVGRICQMNPAVNLLRVFCCVGRKASATPSGAKRNRLISGHESWKQKAACCLFSDAAADGGLRRCQPNRWLRASPHHDHRHDGSARQHFSHRLLQASSPSFSPAVNVKISSRRCLPSKSG